MDEQQKQAILDPAKVIAVGVASPAGAALTSRFGVAGTLVGLALSAVIITVVTDVLKVYLARVPGAVTTIPGGFKKRPRWQRMLYALRHPFSKFASLAPVRRRSILRGSAVAGAMAFVVGLIIVTGVEASVGKSFSCWVWNECPEARASSSDGTTASTTTSTLPSILGGGSSVSTNTPQPTAPSSPPSPSSTPAASPPSPPPASSPGSETPNPSSPPSSSYRQESSSSSSESEQGTSEEVYEQSSSESSEGDQRQQPTYQQQSEYTQPTEKSGGGDQREAPPPLHWFTT